MHLLNYKIKLFKMLWNLNLTEDITVKYIPVHFLLFQNNNNNNY